MSALAIKERFDKHKAEMYAYIEGYWYENDIWELENKAVKESLINSAGLTGVLVDFRTFKSQNLKMEMKFYLLHALKERELSVSNVKIHYKKIVEDIGRNYSENSFNGSAIKPAPFMRKERGRLYEAMQGNVIRFITDFYDERPELERDKWHALLIPGVKLSAAIKRNKPSICFEEIPAYYRESVKRYMKTLIYRRSWSFCSEILIYIRYFYKSFYVHDYQDGFHSAGRV